MTLHREAAECLRWALDLLDIYDEMAIKQFRQDETVVLTEQHVEAKLRARQALAQLDAVG